MIDLSGLKELVEVRSASGNEGVMKAYLLDHLKKNQSSWKTQPKVIEGDGLQDGMIWSFGKPRTAIFVHMDSIGFMVGYENNLVPIGGPRKIDGIQLVGTDSQGEIDTEMMVIDNEDGSKDLKIVSERILDRGTNLTFKPNYRESDTHIQSPYMDNRLGLWVALKLCETIEDGVIVFSTYEEAGGGSVGFLGKYLIDHFNVSQALICDITWVTEGILEGQGAAISMHDKGIPRKSFVDKIIQIAQSNQIQFQLEVESSGGSDGTMLQQTELPFDWCFIGAPEQYVHTPDELVNKADIVSMIDLYRKLIEKL